MAATRTLSLSTEAETVAFAGRLAAAVGPGDLIVLEGDLGAGKTFLVRALCYALGLPQDELVTSPTFTLVQELDADIPIVHADLYRLGGGEELLELGLEERIGADALVLVEWGERFLDVLGAPTLLLRMEIVGETERRVQLTGGDGCLREAFDSL